MSTKENTAETVEETIPAPDRTGEDKTKNSPAKQNKDKQPKTGACALKSVGLAACKRNNLTVVWVTADGQAFALECDAKAHAKNLPNQETLKVSAK